MLCTPTASVLFKPALCYSERKQKVSYLDCLCAVLPCSHSPLMSGECNPLIMYSHWSKSLKDPLLSITILLFQSYLPPHFLTQAQKSELNAHRSMMRKVMVNGTWNMRFIRNHRNWRALWLVLAFLVSNLTVTMWPMSHWGGPLLMAVWSFNLGYELLGQIDIGGKRILIFKKNIICWQIQNCLSQGAPQTSKLSIL